MYIYCIVRKIAVLLHRQFENQFTHQDELHGDLLTTPVSYSWLKSAK